MKKLTLARSYLSDRTVGVLKHSDMWLSTLERPWLDNMPNISCIPEGVYLVKRDKTGRHQWYAVQDVEGRTNIEFHPGNSVGHSEGCILVGESHDGSLNLINSNQAMMSMLEYIGNSDFLLHIRAATKEDW
jgi:hypothetical protein